MGLLSRPRVSSGSWWEYTLICSSICRTGDNFSSKEKKYAKYKLNILYQKFRMPPNPNLFDYQHVTIRIFHIMKLCFMNKIFKVWYKLILRLCGYNIYETWMNYMYRLMSHAKDILLCTCQYSMSQSNPQHKTLLVSIFWIWDTWFVKQFWFFSIVWNLTSVQWSRLPLRFSFGLWNVLTFISFNV